MVDMMLRRTGMVLSALVCCVTAVGAEYYSDPAVPGGGDGSGGDPWPALKDCISNGSLATLQPGDTLYLRDGYHGYAQFTGANSDFVTIAAQDGHTPLLARLVITSAAKWHIKGLTISASLGNAYSGAMVSFCDSGSNNGQIILEGCHIFGVDDHRGLDAAAWMGLNSGVLMGRHGVGSIVRDCHIRNTRFALTMSAHDGIAEGNIIGAYSADGIRMTRDGQRASDNVIKGAFVGSGDGDPNHDDAIQCFLFNVGTGTVRDIRVQRNLILGHDPDGEPLAAVNQAIGFFDGPLVNFVVEDNVINVSHWHGVSLYDAQGCTIARNTVWNAFENTFKPWVRLDNKLGLADGNTVTDNYAVSFHLDEPDTTASNNQPSTQAIFDAALTARSQELFTRYSVYHCTSRRHRVTEELADGAIKRNIGLAVSPLPEATIVVEHASAGSRILDGDGVDFIGLDRFGDHILDLVGVAHDG